jgi:alpha 1,3-glucosidase
MIKMIDKSNRRLVVITDPHIKDDKHYKVLKNGLAINQQWNGTEYINVFVEDRTGEVMYGYCWPGTSTWVDYINEGARRYWASLYSYDHFEGTNELFHIWLDMNEPSVFDGTE